MSSHDGMPADAKEEGMEEAMELGMDSETFTEASDKIFSMFINAKSVGTFVRRLVDECYKCGNEDTAIVTALFAACFIRSLHIKMMKEERDNENTEENTDENAEGAE